MATCGRLPSILGSRHCSEEATDAREFFSCGQSSEKPARYFRRRFASLGFAALGGGFGAGHWVEAIERVVL